MPLSATLLALASILMWSFLAFLGARLSHLPPFLVVGMALCVSGLIGSLRFPLWRVSLATLLVGIGGIFGYHFLYFSAFQHAPAVEANLMNYLWPLLIVLLSPVFLAGYRLRPNHLLGAGLGLAGAGLILTGGQFQLDLANLWGYLLAAGAALVWACYSLMTKRLPPFPTSAVGAFCLASGLLSLGAYWTHLGRLSLPSLSGDDWLSLILLGAGPMGGAFFTWDAALKRGDPRIIGSLTYLTPLTSTLILTLVGGRRLTWVSAIAMLLIVGGALIGCMDLWRLWFIKKNQIIPENHMKVQINDFSMAYTDSGQGLPLVFVHGYPLNRRIWQPQADGLANIARVLAPDLRGHGGSQAVPGPYSMDLFADDLTAFLDALGVTQPAVLCGLSMGGYLAFAFYRKFPARLKGLILTATRAAADTPQGKANRDLAAEAARKDGVGAIVEKMLPIILSPSTHTGQPELMLQVRRIMESTSLEGVLGDLAALKERPDSTPTLSQIKIPSLVVHGEQDQIIPYEEAFAMHEAIPGSQWALIPNAGHLPCLENPAAYNQAVRSFLQTLGG